jgi:hypothetical protein
MTTIKEQFEATTQAVLAADEAHLYAAENVEWQRQGILGRLTRVSRPAVRSGGTDPRFARYEWAPGYAGARSFRR